MTLFQVPFSQVIPKNLEKPETNHTFSNHSLELDVILRVTLFRHCFAQSQRKSDSIFPDGLCYPANQRTKP